MWKSTLEARAEEFRTAVKSVQEKYSSGDINVAVSTNFQARLIQGFDQLVKSNPENNLAQLFADQLDIETATNHVVHITAFANNVEFIESYLQLIIPIIQEHEGEVRGNSDWEIGDFMHEIQNGVNQQAVLDIFVNFSLD